MTNRISEHRLGDIANVPEMAEYADIEDIALELLDARERLRAIANCDCPACPACCASAGMNRRDD